MVCYRHNHQASYPAHYQLLLLLELLDEQGLDRHYYLKGTGLFFDDIVTGHKRISALQFIKVIENAQSLGDPSTPFRWGHAMWPGHYDEFSQLLNGTDNLRELLSVLHDYSEMFSPMMKPVLLDGDDYTFIYWRDEIGVASIQPFLVAAYSTALLSLSHWYAQHKLPWRVGFSHNKNANLEEYIVNLGDYVHFNIGVDCLALKQEYLNVSWSSQKKSHAVLNITQRKVRALYENIAPGLVGAVSLWCQNNIEKNPSLEDAAKAFNMSSATFKRKLKNHFTSYQKIQDQARLVVCLYLLHHKQWNNIQVAHHLQFSDANNFRKAFKRWCGNTPSDMREKLGF